MQYKTLLVVSSKWHFLQRKKAENMSMDAVGSEVWVGKGMASFHGELNRWCKVGDSSCLERAKLLKGSFLRCRGGTDH